ncbi:caspase family protein [Methylobacterium tardum]|uniref:caspase family protein n=1 Tax=Methylobacterium tardum TaxID=374432 RepID=UPI00360ACDCE
MAQGVTVSPDSTGLIYRSADDGPGLHALLIGISSYKFLKGGEEEQQNNYGLDQLDSAARTASEIQRWLLEPSAELAWPVRTIRLLASPSEVEAYEHPVLANCLPATLANLKRAVRAWRIDASQDPTGATLFYYSGHGIQRTRGDSLLLLADFLDPSESLLGRAIDFIEIYNGMAEPPFECRARTQFYFADACRTDVRGIQALANPVPATIWDISEGGRDDRVAPIFFGASVGRPAFGSLLPCGISAFGADVLACLSGGSRSHPGAERRSMDGNDRLYGRSHGAAR